MTRPAARSLTTPKGAAPGVRRIQSPSGVAAGILPNGSLHALEHEDAQGRIMISQVLGSPLAGGIGRLYLRLGGTEGRIVQATGPGAQVRLAVADDRAVWAGEADGVRHRTTLWLHPRARLWTWRVEVRNAGGEAVAVDALLVQDLGLGERGFVMGNEAYASQYIDHQIERHERFGPVVMSRQALGQRGRHPWVAHGCLEGAASFATDALQLFGPAFRDKGEIEAAAELPSQRLQHEAACAMLRSQAVRLAPGEETSFTFFGLLEPDHPAASGAADLARLEGIEALAAEMPEAAPALEQPVRSLLQDAPPAPARPLDPDAIAALYPERLHEERRDGRLLSFFVPDGPHNRHVVLDAKELEVTRRHGAILKSGSAILPDETTLSVTCWMHGVLAAQLTIGNTAFHKLFSVSRDPYNLTRASGLRMLVDAGQGWRLLTVPSAFEMGLSDCRWLYRLPDRTVSVRAIASGEDPALAIEVEVDGPPCRLLAFGHIVLGERELEQAGRIEIDAKRTRISFRPDPDWLWGQRHPEAVYHLVTATPEAVEAIGGDELLYPDGQARDGAYVAILTKATKALRLAVVGAMSDPAEAERLAQRYAAPGGQASPEAATRSWSAVTRDIRLSGQHADIMGLDTLLPWMIHDAVIHVAVPHGLEQYTGAAWGTRDVCQGPVELLLALRHDPPVKEILRTVLAQQYEKAATGPSGSCWSLIPSSRTGTAMAT